MLAVDIASVTYSYSFEPNPHWSRLFAPGSELKAYADHVADKYDLRRHIEFGVEVTAIEYDEKAGEWSVQTDRGETIRTQSVITAVGQLSRPAFPSITGRDTFEGPSFHSAEWDHSVDLTGKRVAVIGTGASAIQFVPEIQPRAAKLELFRLPEGSAEFTTVDGQ